MKNLAFIVFHPVDCLVINSVYSRLSNHFNIYVFLISKEGIEEDLLKSFGIKPVIIGSNDGKSKYRNALRYTLKIRHLISKLSIDIIYSATAPYVALASMFKSVKLIGLTDTETAGFNNKLAFWAFDSIITPDAFYGSVPNEKHINLKTYKELSYLHPNRFVQNVDIPGRYNFKTSDKIILMRFSALKAMHDIGIDSVSDSTDLLLSGIRKLEQYGKVFISMTEKDLGVEFQKYRLDIAPQDYTQFLSYCSLYIGEGTTTASEAGVTGVPWINIHTQKRGYLLDQQNNYKLGYIIPSVPLAFDKAEDILKISDSKQLWTCKKEELLKDKIDFSTFLCWFIEDYPQSHHDFKIEPTIQDKF